MTCLVIDCDKPVRNLGKCNKHYMQLYRARQGVCESDGCQNKAEMRNRCFRHYELSKHRVEDQVRLDTEKQREDYWLFVKKELKIE